MKLQPYKKYLTMTKEKIDEALAIPRAVKAECQAELKIAEIEEEMATLEAQVNELCTQKDLNFDLIIRTQDRHALLERRKAQFVKIIGELFPEK